METQVFPQGTNEEEIKEWIEANADQHAGKEVISDLTVRRKAGYEGNGWLILDEIFDDAARIAIAGDQLNDKEVALESLHNKLHESSGEEYYKLKEELLPEIANLELSILENDFKAILKNAIENNVEMPKFRVRVLAKNLSDHPPFEYLRKKRFNEYEEAELKKLEYEIAEKYIQKWLVNVGIPEEKIECAWGIVPGACKDNMALPKPGTWFIADRHNFNNKWDKELFKNDEDKFTIPIDKEKNIHVLLLPFSDFFRTAQEQGFLENLDPEAFKQALNDKFKKLLVKQREAK